MCALKWAASMCNPQLAKKHWGGCEQHVPPIDEGYFPFKSQPDIVNTVAYKSLMGGLQQQPSQRPKYGHIDMAIEPAEPVLEQLSRE